MVSGCNGSTSSVRAPPPSGPRLVHTLGPAHDIPAHSKIGRYFIHSPLRNKGQYEHSIRVARVNIARIPCINRQGADIENRRSEIRVGPGGAAISTPEYP